jgi:ribonuclease VapC
LILDTSAIISLLLEEPGSVRILDALEKSVATGVGSPTLTETGIVLARRVGSGWENALEDFLDEYRVEEISFDRLHWREATLAYRRFGKSWHPARLNFGDCMSYAVARIAGRPLLCTGRDFEQTDLELA